MIVQYNRAKLDRTREFTRRYAGRYKTDEESMNLRGVAIFLGPFQPISFELESSAGL